MQEIEAEVGFHWRWKGLLNVVVEDLEPVPLEEVEVLWKTRAQDEGIDGKEKSGSIFCLMSVGY